MAEERIEKKHGDVLQNIEFMIAQHYHNYPETIDAHVEKVVQALISTYSAEMQNRPSPKLHLTENQQALYDAVKSICDWRLGQDTENDEQPPLTSLEVMIACLKRIRKSITFWTKSGGRQGYLNFVKPFLP
jgi:metal-dependent amidase/aminoacylase/carboxypeptidase family protein